MIEEGYFRVLGGNNLIYTYLAGKPEIIAKLYPSGETELKIKSLIGWYINKIGSSGAQISKLVLDPKSYVVLPKKKQLDKFKGDFISHLNAINGKLVGGTYLAGNKSTMADYIIYNELSQFLSLLDIDIDKSEDFVSMTYLKDWFQKTMKNNNDELMVLDKKMKDAFEKTTLFIPQE